MDKKTILRIILATFLINLLALMVRVQLTRAEFGSIYIRADGSVEPSTVPISSTDNVTYFFAADIFTNDSVIVQRDNIIIDGANHFLESVPEREGFRLEYRNNITIRNAEIRAGCGIFLDYSTNSTIYGNKMTTAALGIQLQYSNSCTIRGNLISDNGVGIWLSHSCSNIISMNDITDNMWALAVLFSSNDNAFDKNNLTANGQGINCYSSMGNILVENNISNNSEYGIFLQEASTNEFYHNDFMNNALQVYNHASSGANTWDDSYPSGGNYWSDYNGTDRYSGLYQNETGSDGIGDTPYILNEKNTDHYPLVHVNTSKDWETIFIEPEGHPFVDFAAFEGKLYAAANNALYMYDSASWSIINASAYVTSIEPFEDKLYVGAQSGLYSFDGMAFNLIFPVHTYIRVLGVYNSTLYAGTILDNPPTLYYCRGGANNSGNWYVDTGFSDILNFSALFGSIDSFAEYNGNLYVASGGTVYCFNGTDWSNANIGYEYAEAYLDMAVYNGKLYLATRDKPTRFPRYLGGSGFSGTLLEFDGTNWTTLLNHDYWIYSLEVYNGKLYVGTDNRIYVYDGSIWNVAFYSQEGAYYVTSMTTFEDKLYAGIGNGYIIR